MHSSFCKDIQSLKISALEVDFRRIIFITNSKSHNIDSVRGRRSKSNRESLIQHITDLSLYHLPAHDINNLILYILTLGKIKGYVKIIVIVLVINRIQPLTQNRI